MNEISLADRVSHLRPTAVNRVLQKVRQLEAEGRSLVSLMRGQPDTPTPSHIVEAAVRSLRDGRTGYPDNRGEPRCAGPSPRSSGASRASPTTPTARSSSPTGPRWGSLPPWPRWSSRTAT